MPTATHNSRFARISLPLLLGIVLLATGRPADAQNNYGSIVGTVTDPTGAQVPAAKVDVKNNETNAMLTTKTSSSGSYSVLNLNPGTYTVTVSVAR